MWETVCSKYLLGYQGRFAGGFQKEHGLSSKRGRGRSYRRSNPSRTNRGKAVPETCGIKESALIPGLGFPVPGWTSRGLDTTEWSFEGCGNLALPKKPSSCPREAGKEGGGVVDGLLCMSLFFVKNPIRNRKIN
ncbi:hypothetical protein NC651_039953 [Populus alba x Populus x berolinensis]|nr:hypothetical protein NC651_039953 [Populus alba x Populus x berolinensis]